MTTLDPHFVAPDNLRNTINYNCDFNPSMEVTLIITNMPTKVAATTRMSIHCMQPFLHPVENARGAAGGGGHMEMVLAESRRHAIIHHHAVVLQHQAVAAFADTQLQPAVGIETVQELNIKAHHLTLQVGHQ